MQHQTSTHAGNILSSYGNPCKLNPCPIVCYVLVLTKEQGKGKWALSKKNLAKALDDYLAKEGCLEDPFSKQTLRNYQPCVSTPKTPEQHKECVKQKRLSITNLAQYFYRATLEEHPIYNYDPDRVLFGSHAMERKCINSYTLDLERDDIEGHLLEQLLKK